MTHSKRIGSILMFLGTFAFCVAALGLRSLEAQDSTQRERRGPGGMGGQPPWMQGGPGGGRGGPGGMGGQPPWMQGGLGGGRGGPGGMGGQPPWMQGGNRGGQGGDRQRPGNEAERNERMIGMLRSMDQNGDGKLDPSEIPEYRRNFVSSVVTRMGGDPNRTIDLNDLARRASSGSASRSGGSTSGRATLAALATDPLVPYFGEKEETQAPILAFGQKEPAPKASAVVSSNASAPVSQADKILRQARDIMNRFDKNKNGTLDKDKGEWVAALPIKADATDTNRDGRISMTELIAALGGTSGASTGAAAVSTRQSDAYDRLPAGVPDWFFERDKDKDGQLTMLEYAVGKPWTEALADEFLFLDKNNDGIATVTEIFEVLKQLDEEKRLKEELAQREQERRRGTGAASTTPVETKESAKPDETSPGTPETPPPSSPPGPPSTSPAPAPPTSVPSTAPYAGGSSDSDRSRRPSSRRSSRR